MEQLFWAKELRCGLSALSRHSLVDLWIALSVYLYFVLLPVPMSWDLPLIFLAGACCLAAFKRHQFAQVKGSSVPYAVLLFVVAVVISICSSTDSSVSLKLCVSFLPGIFLFILIAYYFTEILFIRFLYTALTAVSLIMSMLLIVSAYRAGTAAPAQWIFFADSPILVVPNDITFFTLTASFSLCLLYSDKSKMIRLLTIVSIFLCAVVACIYQSAVALLAMAISAFSSLVMLRPRHVAASAVCFLFMMTLLDAMFGFPLSAKFLTNWSQRLPLWLSSLAMFRDAPFLGNGLHTFGTLYLPYFQHVANAQKYIVDPRFTPWVHNLYLEVLAEQGIVGAAALMGLLGSGGISASKTSRNGKTETAILAKGAYSALIGFCFAALFELSFLRLWVVALLFMLLGVVARLSMEPTQRRTDYV